MLGLVVRHVRSQHWRGVVKGLKSGVRSVARAVGYEVARYREYPIDFDAPVIECDRAVRNITQLPQERVHTLVKAVEYIVRHNIAGGIIECGVKRGGAMMAAALTLKRLGAADRSLYLFDTFHFAPPPQDLDRRADGISAAERMAQVTAADFDSIEDVRRNMASTGYDPALVHLVEGRVEDTIPDQAPERIALLRLDTDWYESTKHELVHLFPRLVDGGILIIDDYGDWLGCRKAVDEYFAETGYPIFLARTDRSERVGMKRG